MRIDYPQENQLNDLKKLWQEAFGDESAYVDCFYDTAFSPDRCRCVTVEDQLAGGLYWLDCRCHDVPMAYLYAVATDKKFRNQGICHALMEDTHRLLKELGYAGAILVPGEESLFQFYAAMGYETCGGMIQFTCKAEDPIPLQEISAMEYAQLRRERLPAGGVIQEGENLAFLSRLVKFYRAESCIFCAGVNDDRLFCLELLGDSQLAGAITGALGAASGTFRIPGAEAFAMYRGFSATPAPSYFAFSFD